MHGGGEGGCLRTWRRADGTGVSGRRLRYFCGCIAGGRHGAAGCGRTGENSGARVHHAAGCFSAGALSAYADSGGRSPRSGACKDRT